MPTSTYSHILAVVRFLRKVMPLSILDIGIGNGKMGFIARDLLDVMLGERYSRKDWKILIDGIEVFSDYIQEHQKAIYNNIYIGDASDVIDKLDKYDLIILGDVLEHLPKEKAWQFIDKCIAHCSNSIILNIPLGERWTQPEIYGNPYEKHLSFWDYEEFEPFVTEKELFIFEGIGYYGCLLIKREDCIHHNIRKTADRMYSEGKHDEAISYMIKSLVNISPDIRSEYLLIDFLLRKNRLKDAVKRLRVVTETFPEEESAKRYLEQIHNIVKDNV